MADDPTRTVPSGTSAAPPGPPDLTGPFAPASVEPPPAPAMPGYELIEVLGRGRMGVGYKARQLATSRTVAVKMVLPGTLDSPAARGRFRAEAEAAARLSHPHVVQVYEAGEAGGRAFLSCEFVPGGSLAARLDGTPWP